MSSGDKDEGDKVLTLDTMNPRVKEMKYAVRGPILVIANNIDKELQAGVKKPFSRLVRANIGDCHATGQTPITYIRQVVALCTYPELLKSNDFPDDVKEHAQRLLKGCRGQSIGSYTESPGIGVIREDIAEYIKERDGHPSSADDIILTTGASDGIKTILGLLLTGESGNKRAGIMIPIPQYPLYTAAIAEFNAYPIPYYLDEENNWGLDLKDLKRAINEARDQCIPRAIVVINPGNPTGQVLSRENIENIVKFAKEEKLFILADEVYQHNIYAKGSKFYSFKKIITELGGKYAKMELASFMSASKGFMGECGYRGGYCEAVNLDTDVRKMLSKNISAKLCPPVSGQIVMDCVVNPPKQEQSSYELFQKEKTFVLEQLKAKGKLVTDTFNAIDGIKCNEVMGAMYAFPRVFIPPKAVEEAKSRNQTPDDFYCYEVLENIGICTVPGSGFGEKEGTYHFRITILPPQEQMKEVLARFKVFHDSFMEKYK